ncbi:dihydrolipoyl dehydrogenase [Rubrimonas cliftonensis]|uniref:Dihydrolipoyl dehydrogenase n=1 Tax=Rubrimonas cliftonensis TaxID=89524 RepID=A0A1H4ECZ7_9RHOB|nr:dihydrolipoyl dehydrogenase [Rubrimonas cliftonensis]SEA82697.1 dihydrolipoamide dehydrogenase [Rubrimonas cliftonensis]
MAEYDVIIIGGGPGGYVCAIRAAQLGLKTAVVEGRGALGGTCLNVGCIPSKALLHASEFAHEAEGNFAAMGINAKSVSVDVPKMLGYKQSVVDSNVKGIEFLFKKNKVDWIKGWGRISAKGEVTVEGENAGVHKARNIVIATGSEPSPLKGVEVDQERVVDSTGALDIPKVPRKLVIIGAGVIGLELGSVWKRLGSEVAVIEYLDQITPGMDLEVCKTFQKILRKQGIDFVMGAAVSGVEKLKTKLKVAYSLRKDDSAHEMDADVVLVATGRRPFTKGLGLEALGVALDERGRVRTDAHWRTNVEGVLAIGDVIAGPMLAHKAEDEGVAVAEQLAGQHGHVNYGVIPSVIYTSPEVAMVGQTEEQLKEAGRAYKAGKFSFMGNGRAKAHFATDGFVKILADKATDRILGAHVIGPMAGDLIHEVCVAMEFGASAEDLARTCHAHPTFSEAMREAAMACGDGPIHG